MEELEFAGLRFRGLTKAQLLDPANWPLHVITVNAEMIVRSHETDPRLKGIINQGTATFDGQIPYVLARLIRRSSDIEKISGSDLIYDIAELSGSKGLRLFLLGGTETAMRQSLEVARGSYGANVDGYSPPYSPYPFPDNVNNTILERLEHFRPDVVLVGFGAGKQEYWIDDNAERLFGGGVKLAVGVGGSFEFFAGQIRRAPVWVQKAGVEGLFRFLMEPKLFRLKRLIMSLRMFRYIFTTA